MPPLELTVDSLDAIEEAIRPLYAERDGKFHLDVRLPPPVDTSGLRRALEAERTAKAAAEERLKGLKDVDPERYRTLLKESEDRAKAEAEAARKAAEARGEYERLQKEQADAHTKALADATAAAKKLAADKDAEITALRTSMQREKLEAEATRALSAARGVPELLLPHIRSMSHVVDRNGTMVVEVLDAEGKPRTNTAGGPFTLTDLVNEMKGSPIYARAFEAENRSGTGSNGTGTGGTGGLTQEQINAMSLAEYRKARSEGRIA